MESSEYKNKQEYLIDRWCARKQLNPLRHILNGRSGLNGLTDGWESMLTDLKSIRSECKAELVKDEFDTLVELIHETEELLGR